MIRSDCSMRSIQAALVIVSSLMGSARAATPPSQLWIEPGAGSTLPAASLHDNLYGQLEILNASGPIDERSNAFFAALGTNGRACVSCHQPAYAMSVSAGGLRERWRVT